MNFPSRWRHRDHVITSFALAVDPVRRLIESHPNEIAKIPFVESQYRLDKEKFASEVYQYCRIGVLRLATESGHIINASNMMPLVHSMRRDPSGANAEAILADFKDRFERTLAAINAVPCDDPSIIQPAESPFTTYLHLRSVLTGATSRIDLIDPYLRAEAFHRYLADLPASVMLQVVTSDTVMTPKSDVIRRDAIVAVSELLARERKSRYRFLVAANIHDRHARIDDKIIHLGGSVVDASKSCNYSISTLDPNPTNHAALDGVITNATEWYGPTMLTHRKV